MTNNIILKVDSYKEITNKIGLWLLEQYKTNGEQKKEQTCYDFSECLQMLLKGELT